jgi:NitT/TauT family transport system substrate-binding protein
MNTSRALVPFLFLVAACGERDGGADVVRIGHFPNVTHAQGLVGHATTREGKGWFEERLGPGVAVEWHQYNAGPEEIQALLAGSLDAAYVGPSPALNAYVKSGGDEVRVVAGAARGGAALVVQGDDRIKEASDFKGRTVATPQIGNTQDVACRAWLAEQGFKITQTGGDVKVLPTQNPEQLSLFASNGLDAAWTVEPWVSRLVKEAKAKVFLEDKETVTTVLVASAKFLRTRPDAAKKLVQANAELTAWLAANAEEAQAKVRGEIKAETRADISPEMLAGAWSRLTFDAAVYPNAFDKFVKDAQAAGFLKDAGDLSRFVEVPR